MTARNSSSQAFPNMPHARGQAILSAIIREHLVTGEPVGSRTLSDRFSHASGWSPATIRHVMGELEEAGLVEQPHTSAGRIPTDKGYRFYVDHSLGDTPLSQADLTAINSLLSITPGEAPDAPNRLLEKTSRLLSVLSENVGIVVSPSLADDRLQHIQFVQLADNRILVVLVSAPNIVHNKIIRVDEKLSQEELERTARYLNTEFAGKSLLAIRAEILELMREEKALYDTLLRNAMLLCDSSLEGEEAASVEVYVDGASNIVTKSEFGDAETMRELFRTFEEKSRLVRILNECVAKDQVLPGEVQIVIGSEHAVSSMKHCALITAPYRTGHGETVGTLSVVGPVRIEYARMISVVNYIARLIERLSREEASSA
jgi:heat-inducible transcriptional repressor